MRIPPVTVVLALIGFAFAGDAFAADQSELSRYSSSSYDYCDAKLLAAYWGQDIEEAKARIGRKLGWGDTDVIESMLDSARERARTNGAPTCGYWEAGYSYEDAEALSAMWGVPISQAKATMESKILWGNEDLLKEEIARAGKGAAPTQQSDEESAMRRFFDSEYCYCDARVLGTFWGEDTSDAKSTIGRKLGWGNKDLLDGMLKEARQAAVVRGETCDLYETNYTPEDAAVLSKVWKKSLTESKAQIGTLVISGRDGQVKAALARAKAMKKGG